MDSQVNHCTEDEHILKKFKQESSKHEAFRQIVEKYKERVYWHIRKMVISHDDADDLTQEVFLIIWNKLATFQGKAQLFTWIYRIATNECLNFLHKKKKRFFLPIHDITQELTEKLYTEDYIEDDEIQRKLQKALLTLPEKQRLVFNMRYFDQLDYEQISEILGTSVGALKASYHHAVKKIEEYLDEN